MLDTFSAKRAELDMPAGIFDKMVFLASGGGEEGLIPGELIVQWYAEVRPYLKDSGVDVLP